MDAWKEMFLNAPENTPILLIDDFHRPYVGTIFKKMV